MVVLVGQTVGEIVERLVPDGRAAYQDALAAVLSLNQSRFPGGQASRVGAGFRLWLPLSMVDRRDSSSTSTTAATNATPSADMRSLHTMPRAGTLPEVAALLFPNSPGAIENALADLQRLNANVLSSEQRAGRAVLLKGTALHLSPWMITALNTPLPDKLTSASLRGGLFVEALPLVSATAAASEAANETRVAALATAAVLPDAPVTDAAGGGGTDTVVAQVTTLDRAQAEEDRLKKLMAGKPKAYEDKVLDASTLPAQRDDNTEAAVIDAAGFRGYLVETRIGFADDSTGPRSTEFGVRTEYRHETLNHGEFVAQADVRTRQGDGTASIGLVSAANNKTSARVTLRNLGFPITTQLFADIALGDQSVQVTDAFSRAYRLSLGSGTVRGVSAHLFSRELDVRMGLGERGVLSGGPYPGFERSKGALAWLGATQRFGTDAFFGAQLSHASGLQSYVPTSVLGGLSDPYAASSGAVAVGYGSDLVDAGSSRARVTLVASNRSGAASADGSGRSGAGVFAEAGRRIGGYRHEFGAYWSQVGLMFGDAALASDSRGAYWRVDRNAGRLFWGMGLDFEDTNPSREASRLAQRRIGVNGNAQYRLDRDSSIGGSANASDVKYTNADVYPVSGDGTRSYNASLFYQTRFSDWGRSRLTATLRHNQVLVANDLAASGQEVQWEHDWVSGKYETMRPEFVTTLGYARDTSGGQVQSYPTAGVQWKYFWDADWSFGGNLRYTSRTGNLATSRGLSGAVMSEKIFNNGWRVGLQASINEARVDTTTLPGGISGAGTVSTTRSNSKSVFLYVRWEGASGTPYNALGLRTAGSAGSGGVSGIVYFDANRDGSQQADERGVPNVEVVLDGRYRVTTDRDGRFEFPLVPTGQHRITLVLDSVPLPWGAALERGLGVDVPLRGTATANIPVVKVGE